MERLILVRPGEEHEAAVMDYRRRFLCAGEVLHGCAGLERFERYGGWLQMTRDNCREETVHAPLVPATTFLALREEDGQLAGVIDVRHRLNDYLLAQGGHIGYSVHPDLRRRGYAKQMLSLALEECHKMGMRRVLVTCDKENAASARTIRANGGVLENEVEAGGRTTQRYWIALS